MITLNILGAGDAEVIPGTAYLERKEEGFNVIAMLHFTETNAVGELILVKTPSEEVGDYNVALFNVGAGADDKSLDDVQHCQKHKQHSRKHRHSD
jgi:hypothetical protein